jgi:uncharacterized protein YegP (UPF0339 family)
MILNIRALAVLAALSLSTAVGCTAPTEEDAQAEETNQDLVSRSASFESFQGLDGLWYFHLVAGNGENVLRSQSYTRLSSAESGVASVLANGNDKRQFEVKQASNGDWYFDLKADNGEIIGTSQLYASEAGAERGARTVRALVRLILAPKTQPAPRVQRFEIFQGEDRKTYFHLRAGNGEIVLSSQGYTAASSAKSGIASVTANGADPSSYEVFETADGEYAIRLLAQNHEVIARSEAYASKSNADRAVARLSEILSAGKLPVSE